ncbi:tyrosine-type recombinase/integrase [Nocardioides psychrotolerans]|uniref:tyrosine-type recombinase/integrase n=1 Tax=Nocardioides psychrotolerans TaxID=1005945 RepID=UPI0034E97A9A
MFHAATFLAGYSGNTREVYGFRLRLYFQWCEDQGLDPLRDVTRPHLELYARHLEEVRNNAPASVHGALCMLRMFYRNLVIDQHIPFSPAEYVRMPKVYFDEVSVVGMTRAEATRFLQTAVTMTPGSPPATTGHGTTSTVTPCTPCTPSRRTWPGAPDGQVLLAGGRAPHSRPPAMEAPCPSSTTYYEQS